MSDLEPYKTRIPNLRRYPFEKRSEENPDYNCIAWAAGESWRPWWPPAALDDNAHWPEGVPAWETLDAFVKAFETLGYSRCEGVELEPGLEKVAIYVSETTCAPTHAARQLESGLWTSKLSGGIDIEHEHLEAVGGSEGFSYGRVAAVMCRERTGQAPEPPDPPISPTLVLSRWPRGDRPL